MVGLRTPIVALFLSMSVATAQADWDDFDSGMKTGAYCKVHLNDLHPTKAVVGLIEVKVRISKMKDMSPRKLKAYLKDHIVPIVIGPQGVPYIIDHHHLSYALLSSRLGDDMFAEIKANWKGLTKAEFWREMKKRDWVYLNGLKPDDLPEKLIQLTDDPYRSLAFLVRESGGFKKVSTPFAEFKWAEYFRAHLRIHDDDKDLKKVLVRAMEIVHSDEAKSLPGYFFACNSLVRSADP